jgi:hypothetical protein
MIEGMCKKVLLLDSHPVLLIQPQTGVVSVETSYADGRLECRLMRNISVSGDPQFFSLNGTSYYLLLAFGPNVLRKYLPTLY